MGIKRIRIRKFKSIEDITLDVQDLQILIGENSVGKSNILDAICYFYDNLCFRKMRMDIFNNNNPFSNRIDIEVVFDLSKILMKINRNIKIGKTKYENYYKKINGMSAGKNEFVIKMHQIKDGKIYWNTDYYDRKVISGLFPLYFVDTRKLNTTSWNELWNTIGDLIKIDDVKREIIHSNFRKEIEKEEYGLKNKYDWIESSLDNLDLKVKQFTSKEYAALMSQELFSGKEFLSFGKKLDVQSNGINTFNYLCLLIKVLDNISVVKLKEPVVIIDEPEISLHNQLIDILVKNITNTSENIAFLISTHSTRMVKDVLKLNESSRRIYYVYKRNKNTHVSRFNLFYGMDEKKESFFITDEHVNAYFAEFLLFVEGETELELFQNEFLYYLYPKLEHVDVIKALSNDVIRKIVSPSKRNYNVPYISLLDRDKIFTFDYKNRITNIKEEYFNHNKHKEKFYFGDQRKKTYHNKKRIDSMASKCKFAMHNRLLGSCRDANYVEFKKCIDEYFAQYNTIIADTTIEGMIINPATSSYILEFYEQEFPEKYNDLDCLLNGLVKRDNITDLNILRLVFGGENDLLKNISSMKKIWNKEREYSLYKSQFLKVQPEKWIKDLEQCKIAKTKWVSNFFRFYFRKVTNSKSDLEIRKFFLRQNEEEFKNLFDKFESDFKELSKLLKKICIMYNKEVLLKGK